MTGSGLGKPQLPHDVKMKLPKEIVSLIQSFVPNYEKEPPPKTPSPSLQRELARIQKISLKGRSGMYMREYEDFMLD
jgi:hypothetical protein